MTRKKFRSPVTKRDCGQSRNGTERGASTVTKRDCGTSHETGLLLYLGSPRAERLVPSPPPCPTSRERAPGARLLAPPLLNCRGLPHDRYRAPPAQQSGADVLVSAAPGRRVCRERRFASTHAAAVLNTERPSPTGQNLAGFGVCQTLVLFSLRDLRRINTRIASGDEQLISGYLG
jgi:hypothetical protein